MATDGKTTPRACQWDVDGLRLVGLAWGPEHGTPVLALHGWMDHAESFRELAPLLTGCRVVSLDLSGQGLSAHRAAHATYNIWDDLPQIAGVMDRLGWDDCILLGHSRGAIIATLFAAVLPERARAVVALDALVAEPVEDADVVKTLRAFLDQTRMQKSRAARLFESPDDYANRRQGQGNSRATSQAIAGRALEEVPEGYRMRADPRLFASSAIKLNRAQIQAVLQAVGCPVLVIWAADGIRAGRPQATEMARLARQLAHGETQELPGDHHFHLDPAASGPIAAAILNFLDRHDLR